MDSGNPDGATGRTAPAPIAAAESATGHVRVVGHHQLHQVAPHLVAQRAADDLLDLAVVEVDARAEQRHALLLADRAPFSRARAVTNASTSAFSFLMSSISAVSAKNFMVFPS